MEIMELENFLLDCRKQFRQKLEEQTDRFGDFTELLKPMLDKCCSTFEEQCLQSNLAEEFEDFMASLTKGE